MKEKLPSTVKIVVEPVIQASRVINSLPVVRILVEEEK